MLNGRALPEITPNGKALLILERTRIFSVPSVAMPTVVMTIMLNNSYN